MPNRILKESIRTSRNVNSLTDFSYRVWTYLITYVDDFGRGSADPELLKGLVFPRRSGLTGRKISETLDYLANKGMITLYEADGEPYFYFPNWDRHQQIRAKKSKFPAPESVCDQMISDVPVIQSNPNPNTESESESVTRTREADFDAFWSAYPRKVGKAAARRAFEKADAPLDVLLSAVERQSRGDQWTRDGGQYIPNPATWLNQGRWEDEVRPETGNGRAKLPDSYRGESFLDDD